MKTTQVKSTNKYGEGKLHVGLTNADQLLDQAPIIIEKKLENLSARLSKLHFGHPIKKQAG